MDGRCNNPACAQNRDGNEISCMLKRPQSNRVSEQYCRYCDYWEAV